MVLRRRWAAPLAVATMLVGSTTDAHASVDLNSSMTAQCTTASCSVIRFVLSIPDQIVNGTAYTNTMVDRITISALKPVFDFGSVLGVWNASGSLIPGAWSASISPDPFNPSVEIALSSGTLASQPIYLLVGMAAADPNQLYNGSLTYTANGFAGPVGTHFSTGGQVTPEPVTMLMLGTGLLGVAGAKRRKRKGELETTPV